ncbi:extracellular solute-binding protein [Motilimonas sp. 1_MG-2023]|uniref:extracellular solute-binding protein n=1 Tax=Motilimonas sp. 1_MG-2023 TaxID=3062672 RepID=UPI0026E3340E|nr:extracellular solute-binding protein [Motilimonas sp. 1_MG-2023]MDO6526440.1 extracellular solute-binding protein [Motilimonas sp. 1_MG-2023]
MQIRLTWCCLWLGLAAPFFSFATTSDLPPQHGIAMHGDLKYPAGFSHFDYVNPEAPKGGTMRQAARGTFDSFNPFIVKGTYESGLLTAYGNFLIYDTLMVRSDDEPFSKYGLIAEGINVAEDFSSTTFYLNPKATFHDGHPITSEDVIFSFNTLIEQGNPQYKSYYAGVDQVTAIDPLTVRFDFKPGDNRELPLILGELPILPKHYWQQRDFSRSSLEVPLGSGPYKIASFDAGRKVVYQRVKNYWAADLNVNKGRHNFDRLVFDYFRDTTIAFQAFKAGVFDYHQEYSAKNWATAYTGEVFDNKKIIRRLVDDANPQGMQGFFFNLRRDKFKSREVRQAIGLMFDFEWLNRQFFYGAYTRSDSFFAHSELAATGLPSPAELAILEPYRKHLPEDVFTQVYQPPATQGDGNIRPQMRQAVALMEQAGYQLKNGKMLDKQGNQLFFEFLVYDKSFERVIQPYRRNLSRIGIASEIRLVDVSQYINRLNSFDFDITTIRQGQSISPGNEQPIYWSCDAASTPGSRNYAGLCNPVVDELVQQLIRSNTREELVLRTRVLDRVLQHLHFVVPQFYSPSDRIAYWDKFSQPKIKPAYAIGLDTWWAKEQGALLSHSKEDAHE